MTDSQCTTNSKCIHVHSKNNVNREKCLYSFISSIICLLLFPVLLSLILSLPTFFYQWSTLQSRRGSTVSNRRSPPFFFHSLCSRSKINSRASRLERPWRMDFNNANLSHGCSRKWGRRKWVFVTSIIILIPDQTWSLVLVPYSPTLSNRTTHSHFRIEIIRRV